MDLSFLTIAGVTVTYNASLSQYTTFQLGGPCPALIECLNASQITTVIKALRQKDIPYLLIGFGSNILVSDKGINKVIVRYTNNLPLFSRTDHILTVDAGTPLDALAQYAVTTGLDGMTSFSGIPGTVGGAIAGNAGAYGIQISDPLTTLTVLQPDNTQITIPRNNLHFEYRGSDIIRQNLIILKASFTLVPGNSGKMQQQRSQTIQEREHKHGRWQETPCAGSFFRNIAPTSSAQRRLAAGGIIEQAGGKALRLGGAHSYINHANIITRDDGASAQDVYHLTESIKKLVKAKTGIELVREVKLLGSFDDFDHGNEFW